MSNHEPIVDVNQEKIVDMAEEAYKKLQDYMENNTVNMNGSIAFQAAAFIPELVRLNREMKQNLDYSTGMRLELSRQLAESNNELWEKASL